jgi:hypothetical protein
MSMNDKLIECCTKNGATLVNVERSIADFVCSCGTTHHKSVNAMRTSGPFCVDCTKKNTAIKRLQNKINQNNTLLGRGKNILGQ